MTKANWHTVKHDRGTILVSYRTPVAACIDGKWLRTRCKWSVTTTRHINQWIGAPATEVPQEELDRLYREWFVGSNH